MSREDIGNAESSISCRGPGPARKKKEVHQEEGDAQMCPCGEKKKSRTHILGDRT